MPGSSAPPSVTGGHPAVGKTPTAAHGILPGCLPDSTLGLSLNLPGPKCPCIFQGVWAEGELPGSGRCAAQTPACGVSHGRPSTSKKHGEVRLLPEGGGVCVHISVSRLPSVHGADVNRSVYMGRQPRPGGRGQSSAAQARWHGGSSATGGKRPDCPDLPMASDPAGQSPK